MSSIWIRPELEEQIRIYKEALKACTSGSSYTIGTRSLIRQDMAAIRDHLDYLAASSLRSLAELGPSSLRRASPAGGGPSGPRGSDERVLHHPLFAPAVATKEATDGDSNYVLVLWQPANGTAVAIRKPGRPGNG